MPIKKFTPKVREDLFEFIKELPFLGEDGDYDIVDFLSEIVPLDDMPSEDHRFINAKGDAIQHLLNNQDWDLDYVFKERFKIVSSNEYFKKFIETVVNPKYRKGVDDIMRFVLLINPYLENDRLGLAISHYDKNGIPVYIIQTQEEIKNTPFDVKHNTIPFFVTKRPNGRQDKASSHAAPNKFPSFVLAFNDGWNDYGIKSMFSLFFYHNPEKCENIGIVKIISKNVEDTSEEIPNEFFVLDESFCSLGQKESYYLNLKENLGSEFESVLYALNDMAFSSDVFERFERDSKFRNSLIRNDSVERLLREVKYSINGYDLSNFLYKFKYNFKPPYSDDLVEVNFDFDNNVNLPSRIFALIGKNGTGKTQLVTSLPIKIAQRDSSVFVPNVPLFSKVIAVSYSIFDTFEIPQKTSSFNYIYCGLRNMKGELMSEQGLVLRFHKTWKRIEELERTTKWKHVLLNFIEEEIINDFIIPRENATRDNAYTVNMEGFHRTKKVLSSGQNIVLFIVSEIVASIRLDSLIIYDEPETHLHPNAITKLMNTIYDLVNEFESYCIVATHSPLVIRELFSRNVLVMERIENSLSVRRIGIESFGENVGNLTEEVFGNKSVPKQYKKIINNLLRDGYSSDEIINLLEFDNIPLSLNARLYIQSQSYNEKS